MRIFPIAAVFMMPISVCSADLVGPTEEVVVVASKIERPLYRVASQVTQLYRDDLQEQQLQTLGEITRYEAALDDEYAGNRFGATGISVRGIGGNRVAMEIDGVPLPQHFAVGEFANASRNLIDPSIIERVEVLRGPASSLYGSDAIGGVVAVTSIDPNDLVEPGDRSRFGGGTNFRTMDSSNSTYLTYARVAENVGMEVSVSRRNSHEMDNKAEVAGTDRIDSTDQAAFAKLTYEVTDSLQVRAIADIYDRETSSDLRSVLGYGRQYASTIALYGDDSHGRERFSLDATEDSLGPFDLINMMVFYQRTEATQDTTDIRAAATTPDQIIERRFELAQKQVGMEGKVRKDFNFANLDQVLVAGVEWERDVLTESRDGLDSNLVTGATSKVLPPGELLPQRDLPTSEVNSTAFYVQDEIHFGDWTFIPAVRFDRFELDASTDSLLADPGRITDLADENISGRMGVTYRFTDSVTGFAHYAEGFRAPPPEDVNLYLEYRGFVNIRALPNPELKSEESRNYELGLRYRERYVSWEVSLYQSHYDNFIESRARAGVDPNDGALLFQSRNISSAQIEGIEVGLSQSLGAFGNALSAWTFGVEFHISKGEDTDTGAPINLVNPAKTVVSLSWNEDAMLGANLIATNYASQTRVDKSGGDFFVPPSATVFDLIAHWSVSRAVTVHGGVFNIADKRYWKYSNVRIFDPADPRVDALSQPGRSFAISINAGF